MIDDNLMLVLELVMLTVLIGLGIWRIFGTRKSATIDASAPVAHDMRQEGQQLSLTPDPR